MIAREQHRTLAPFCAVGLERRTEPRHVNPERVLLALRILSPQLFENAIGRHDAVGVHQQEGQQRTLLVRSQVERCAVVKGLERAEDAEFHAAPLCHCLSEHTQPPIPTNGQINPTLSRDS